MNAILFTIKICLRLNIIIKSLSTLLRAYSIIYPHKGAQIGERIVSMNSENETIWLYSGFAYAWELRPPLLAHQKINKGVIPVERRFTLLGSSACPTFMGEVFYCIVSYT